MLKKYEVENLIIGAFEELDGLVDDDGRLYEATTEFDDDRNLILIFNEDSLNKDNNKPDRYKIKIELL